MNKDGRFPGHAAAAAVPRNAARRAHQRRMQARLKHLHLRTQAAQRLLDSNAAAHLLAANERLVLAALHPLGETDRGAPAPAEAVGPAAADPPAGVGEAAPLPRQLREANQQLLLAALAAQRQLAAAEAAQRRQTDLMAMVAHELRNPLTPILTAAALLGRVHGNAPLLVRLQALIERQVGTLSRLVSDLLDAARLRTGKLRIEWQPMDLADAIDAAVQACRPAMQARGQQFDLHMPAGPLAMQGDAMRLTQVLSNLLDNASKYTPRQGAVTLAAVLAGGHATVTITDSGIGITAAALPLVFQPFVQDTHATGFDGSGLGLGLTVARELVEAHGGTIEARSAGAGLGSQFVVQLPLQPMGPR